CGTAGGIRNSTFGGSMRKQRRQLPTRVRYCTNPQTLHRMTSRSGSTTELVLVLVKLVLFVSATGAPHFRSPACGYGESRRTRGRQKPARHASCRSGEDAVKRFLRE